MDSIRNLLDETHDGGDFYILLGDYLDAFYRAPIDIKDAMISEPPSGRGLCCKRELLAFAAATAHKLANDYNLNVPPWVFDKNYYLTENPFFGCDAKGDLRLLFMYKSPTEFKHRNLFVDENVLKRI